MDVAAGLVVAWAVDGMGAFVSDGQEGEWGVSSGWVGRCGWCKQDLQALSLPGKSENASTFAREQRLGRVDPAFGTGDAEDEVSFFVVGAVEKGELSIGVGEGCNGVCEAIRQRQGPSGKSEPTGGMELHQCSGFVSGGVGWCKEPRRTETPHACTVDE
jgi:hypothetical protein